MIPVEFLRTTSRVADLIGVGDRRGAAAMLEELSRQARGYLDAMAASDAMEVLGNIALRYRELGATEKEIPLLEELCQFAERDLRQLGAMASSDDIYRTALDFLLLGVGYVKLNRREEARAKINEAGRLLSEMEWDIDPGAILADEQTVYIGPKGGREPILKNLPESIERPFLASYNFTGGGRCHVYYPSGY